MSEKLYYRPIKPPSSKRIGGIELRDILKNKYGYPCALQYNDIPFLDGLFYAKIEGAKELIEAIEENNAVECFLQS